MTVPRGWLEVPQPGDALAGEGRARIEKVVAVYPIGGFFLVHIVNDRGHRADALGNPIERIVDYADRSLGWRVVREPST